MTRPIAFSQGVQHMGYGQPHQGVERPIYPESDSTGDSTAKARIEASNTRSRVGSTPAQRKGLEVNPEAKVPAYIPGYGRPSPANDVHSLMDSARWNDQFTPHISPPSPVGSSIAPAVSANASNEKNALLYSGVPELAAAGAAMANTPQPATAPAAIAPQPDLMAKYRSPNESAIMANPNDWKGKVGVNNPPPISAPSNVLEQPSAYNYKGERTERSANSGQLVTAYNPNQDMLNSRFQDPAARAAAGGADRAVFIPQQYGGGVGSANFVHDARSNVDTAGNPVHPQVSAPPVAQQSAPPVPAGVPTVDTVNQSIAAPATPAPRQIPGMMGDIPNPKYTDVQQPNKPVTPQPAKPQQGSRTMEG